MNSKPVASSSMTVSAPGVGSPFIRYWAPALLYAGLIFVASSLSHEPDVVDVLREEVSDKILHAAEYAVLGALLYRAFHHAAGATGRRYAWRAAILVGILYGISDELHQLFVPMREGDWQDLIADAVGVSIGAWIWRWIAHRRSPF